jgi:hypothetical protein
MNDGASNAYALNGYLAVKPGVFRYRLDLERSVVAMKSRLDSGTRASIKGA